MNGYWNSRRLLLVAAFVLLLEGVAEVGFWVADRLPAAIRDDSWDTLFLSLFFNSLIPAILGLTIALIARLPRRLGVAAAAMGAIPAAAALVSNVWAIRLMIRESAISSWEFFLPVQQIMVAVAVLVLAAAVLRAARVGAAT